MTVNADFPFSTREETDAHSSFIRNKEGGKRSSDVRSILEVVFSHQKASFRPKECQLTGSCEICKNQQFDGDTCKYELSNKFYKTFYSAPKLNKDIKEDSETLTVDDFIKKITLFRKVNNNQFTFLLGEVGCGKTAFINYLITSFGWSWFFDKNIFFVRVDIHSGGGGYIHTYDEILIKIFKKIRKILEYKEVKEKIQQKQKDFIGYSKLTDYDLDIGSKEKELAEVINELKRKLNLNVLIIIDNLDQIYHRDDRERFMEALPLEHDSVKPILNLITSFFHENNELGSIESNIVFCLRNETYDIVSQTVEYIFSPDNITKHNLNAFTLKNVDWKEVVKLRLDFLEEISIKCNIAKGKTKDIAEVINPIKNEIYSTSTSSSYKLVDNLSKVTSFGLRCIMDFFSQYSWIKDDSFVVHRYFDQFHIGLLAYMLAGYRRFNQVRSRFPNLYLVNSRTKVHPPTYWLKRLLAEYIYINQSNELETDINKIMAIFTTGERAYSKDIVLECLGSLSEVHESNVSYPVIKLSPTKKHLTPCSIKLTPRGLHLLEELHDKFVYLQLIVEDNYLPFPVDAISYFKFNNSIDYGYLVLPDDEYYVKTKEMVSYKSKQVIQFLELIDASKIFEQLYYADAWDRLEKLRINIDVGLIRENICEEIGRITKSKTEKVDVYEYIKDSKENLRPILDDFFEQCLSISMC